MLARRVTRRGTLRPLRWADPDDRKGGNHIVLRTGEDYTESLRDGREVWIDGERVTDVTTHPAFAPVVGVRARIYDLAHDAGHRDLLTYTDEETGERCATTSRPPRSRDDWRAKRASVDAILDDAGGVVTRVGDETVGEMWSLFDGQSVLNEIDPQFSANIAQHVRRAQLLDPFHVSANTDPKGDRSRRPQDQDPDVLLHVVRETGNGIVVRGAKFETAAARASQAFVKPTIGEWNNEVLSDYAVGFLADMGAPGIRHLCRSAFGGQRSPEDYPLTSRYDEIDTMIVFDDVEIPWENVFFYRHTKAAAFIRATLHRYSIFPYVQRYARFASFLLGVAYASALQPEHDRPAAARRTAGRDGGRAGRGRRARRGRQPGAGRGLPAAGGGRRGGRVGLLDRRPGAGRGLPGPRGRRRGGREPAGLA
jgi:4-hydroxyphenylacetate 3-monooxygenase